MRAVSRSIIAAGPLVLAAGHAAAQQDAFWSNPAGGWWSDAENWASGVAPNNSGQNLFNAVLDLQGGVYQVDLDVDVTLQNLSLLGADTRLNLGSQSLTVHENLSVVNATIVRGGFENDLTVNGQLRLQDSMLMYAGVVTSNGSVVLDGEYEIDICNTGVDHYGSGGILWQGSADLRIDSNGWLTNGPGSVFTIASGASKSIVGDGTGRLNNYGTLIVGSGGRGEQSAVTVSDVVFNNAGAVIVESGSLTLNTPNNLAPGGVLSEGSWAVRNGATLDFGQWGFDTLAAEVSIAGAGSTFTQIAGLTQIAATGRFEALDGYAFTAGATFFNHGEITVGAGSSFTTSVFGLGNLSGTTLAGGAYRVAGLFDSGAERITHLAGAHVTLVGEAAQFTGIDALGHVGSGARFAIDQGRNFTTEGDLTVASGGTISVGDGSVLTVNGTLTNNRPDGSLADGRFEVSGTLVAHGLQVNRIDGELVLNGADSAVLDQHGNDALAGLYEIGESGVLRLREGRSLETIGNLTVEGVLAIEGPGEGRSDTDCVLGIGGQLHFADTAVLSMLIDGSTGRQRGEIFSAATRIDEGATLELILAEGVSLNLGDTISLLETGALTGKFSTVIGADIGNGLWFEVVQDAGAVYAVVVPAPAAAGLLGLAGLAATRRRR